jgi:hypothetical protein
VLRVRWEEITIGIRLGGKRRGNPAVTYASRPPPASWLSWVWVGGRRWAVELERDSLGGWSRGMDHGVVGSDKSSLPTAARTGREKVSSRRGGRTCRPAREVGGPVRCQSRLCLVGARARQAAERRYLPSSSAPGGVGSWVECPLGAPAPALACCHP